MSEVVRLRSAALEWREVEGEVIALDLGSSTYLAINRAGAFLWPALIDGATPAQLAQQLAGEFGLEGEQARRDADAFLDSLRELDLLTAG